MPWFRDKIENELSSGARTHRVVTREIRCDAHVISVESISPPEIDSTWVEIKSHYTSLEIPQVNAAVFKRSCRLDEVSSEECNLTLLSSSGKIRLLPTDVNCTTAEIGVAIGCVTDVLAIHAIDVEVHVVDLSLGNRPKGFNFETRQQAEPASLFTSQVRAPAIPRRPAEPQLPPRPPELEEASLQERLMWLLAPPIDELISDPTLALPENPFPYQIYGIKWLMDRKSALLADEMGLGKTMQAIVAARLLFRTGQISQVLIICPKPLIANWKAELRKWWPNVYPHYIAEPTGDRRSFLKLATKTAVVKLINYDKLALEKDWLKDQKFSHDLIIIDEAQNIKNSSSARSQAVRSLKASRSWALTGTPLENRVDDLTSIMSFVKPGLLNSNATAAVVRKNIPPFILRRRTDEVLEDMPDLIEQTIEIELEDAQRVAYDRLESEARLQLNEQGDAVTVQHIFAQIQKLKQLCNFEPVYGSSAKLERILADFEEIATVDKKALIFSQFVQPPFGIKELAERIAKGGHDVLQFHGEVPDKVRQAVLNDFRTNKDRRALLLNYSTGGVGLNLQVANYVFLFDRWWNPAVEDQAVKRAHRIGAKDHVFVRRFVCKDTIEERIETILAKKRRIFASVIDDGRPDAADMGLSEEELRSLFGLQVRAPKTIELPPPRKILDDIGWKEFEQTVAILYERQGYEVRLTGAGADGGIDVVAERRSGTSLERIVVQCKHQQETVGRPVCQQLYGVMSADHGITSAAVVTSSTFSREAQAFAKGQRILLIDGSDFKRLCREHKVADFQDSDRTKSS